MSDDHPRHVGASGLRPPHGPPALERAAISELLSSLAVNAEVSPATVEALAPVLGVTAADLEQLLAEQIQVGNGEELDCLVTTFDSVDWQLPCRSTRRATGPAATTDGTEGALRLTLVLDRVSQQILGWRLWRPGEAPSFAGLLADALGQGEGDW